MSPSSIVMSITPCKPDTFGFLLSVRMTDVVLHKLCKRQPDLNALEFPCQGRAAKSAVLREENPVNSVLTFGFSFFVLGFQWLSFMADVPMDGPRGQTVRAGNARLSAETTGAQTSAERDSAVGTAVRKGWNQDHQATSIRHALNSINQPEVQGGVILPIKICTSWFRLLNSMKMAGKLPPVPLHFRPFFGGYCKTKMNCCDTGDWRPQRI